MHQQAFPGEDISDRAAPEESVPGLLALIDGELPSGRYRCSELSQAWSDRVSALAFELPTALEAREPAEARGLRARRRPADGRRPASTVDRAHALRPAARASVGRATCW